MNRNLIRRRPTDHRALDLIRLYAPAAPSMLPVYGTRGEIVGWRLP